MYSLTADLVSLRKQALTVTWGKITNNLQFADSSLTKAGPISINAFKHRKICNQRLNEIGWQCYDANE